MLPGTIAANLGLTENERAALAPAIVRLLDEIHGLPINGALAKALPPDTLGRLNITKRMGKIREKISVTDTLGIAFPATIPGKIESLLDPDEEFRIPHCLVHGDLYSRNILIDNRSQISGLIDWTDVHLGHPAKDFAFLLSFLPPQIFENIRSSYRYYSEPLLDLAFMSALNLTCNLAEYAVDIQDQPLMTECRFAFTCIRENFASFR
jgi:aminoglycoside phosphotransferase (APT) family kinase protein